MTQIFPYANVITGVLVLIVGFGFHWIGQVFSLLNWERATRIGLQEKSLLPEYKVYEQAIAVADATIGWIYGIAGLGLILNAEWGYRLAWIPGSILIYHGISAWVWEGNRRASGHRTWSNSMRVAWCSANLITGAMAILVAWSG
jgi:hypothetical protein